MFIEVEVKDRSTLKKRLINIAHIQTVGTYGGEALVYLEGEHYPIVVNNTYDWMLNILHKFIINKKEGEV